MNKRLVFALCLACSPALAGEPAPETITLPTATVSAIVGILRGMPYDQVGAAMNDLNACIGIQMPDKDGRITDKGQCPPVSKALHHAELHPPISAQPGKK